MSRFTGGRVGQRFEHPGPTLPEWATYITDRNPKFKTHKGKGQAVNAASLRMPHHPVSVLRLVKGEWTYFMDYIPPDNCEECGLPFNSPDDRNLAQGDEPQYMRAIICSPCYLAQRIDDCLTNGSYFYAGYYDGSNLDLLFKRRPEYRDKYNEILRRKAEAQLAKDLK